MAKSKETSTPLICALVFFVLTTIAFGVMWYLEFSEKETREAAVKTAKKDQDTARAQATEAERLARVYRIYLGVPRGAPEDDVNVVNTEAKPNDKIAAELKQINDAVAKKVGAADAAAAPEEFKFWQVDASGKAGPAADKGLADLFAAMKNRDAAYKAAEDSAANFRKQADALAQDGAALKKAAADLKAASDAFPASVKKQVQDVVDAFDKRTKQYQQAEAVANKAVEEAKNLREVAERDLRKERTRVEQLVEQNQRLLSERAGANQEALSYDEPQGKILRKLPENVVEINLGSGAGVRPGLTFTVLPADFPAKGRQSRMRAVRVPDGKGGYRTAEQFVPKGAIEVFEVVNERLSLARVQAGSESDTIRDGISQGDLLYNSAWRKGVADHIALAGIFDINGDGADDIEAVVRDLTKMGIPVDAYFDLKKRAWVGQVTERTRYIVEGYYPINSGSDPNREEKTKLLSAVSAAVAEGKQKGVTTINFRDFFGRMGYKFRVDVTDDKINQATAPYLSNAGGPAGGSDAPPKSP